MPEMPTYSLHAARKTQFCRNPLRAELLKSFACSGVEEEQLQAMKEMGEAGVFFQSGL